MVYTGYMRIDGVEIVNAARMDAYTTNMGLGFYLCEPGCDTLKRGLQAKGWSNGDYRLPSTGEVAPWYDPAEPYSAGFAGVSIMDISNIESTTIESSVTQSIRNGGWLAGRRYGTREMVVRALLVGVDLQSVRHGFNWLTSVLRGGAICEDRMRTKHTYHDFLPVGKQWWQMYKDTDPIALPSNVYQANRYSGLAATDDAPDNTYRKLTSGGEDGFGEDTLDILLPLNPPSDLGDIPHCGNGHKFEFFVDCPKRSTIDSQYRYMYDVYLSEGPVVLSYRKVAGSCDEDAGAWQEIEFRLVATDPFIWREEVNLNKAPDPLSYSDVPSTWPVYKNLGPLTVDDDVYQAPLYHMKAHTYNGLESVLWEKTRVFSVSPVTLQPRSGDMANYQFASFGPTPGSDVRDPHCPPAPMYPKSSLDATYCADLPSGSYRSIMYMSNAGMLPKYSPVAFRLAVNSRFQELRGVRVSVLASSWQEDTYHPGFTIAWMPPMSSFVYDGISNTYWLLSGDVGDPALMEWKRADHLAMRGEDQAPSTALTEFMCGSNIVTVVEVPSIYDIDTIGAGVAVLVRDA
jgi:hypothetical protein